MRDPGFQERRSARVKGGVVGVVLAIAILIGGGVSCSTDGNEAGAELPLWLVLLLDLTAHAASPAGIRETSQALTSHPLPSGSVVEAWAMGDRPEETVQIGRYVYLDPKRRGRAAIEGARRRFQSETVGGITEGVERLRSASPPRFSPIAGSITTVVLGRQDKHRMTLVVLTDLREVSGSRRGAQGGDETWDFECGPLPSPERFRRACERQGVLRDGSLEGVRVVVVGVQVEPVAMNRCPWPVSRYFEVTSLFTQVLEAAGAASVEITRDLETSLVEMPEGRKGGGH